jgi:hypothetical protein
MHKTVMGSAGRQASEARKKFYLAFLLCLSWFDNSLYLKRAGTHGVKTLNMLTSCPANSGGAEDTLNG